MPDKEFIVKEGLIVEGDGWTAVVNSSGYFINGQPLTTSGGFYKGNNGDVGSVSSKQNLYKIK
jgi:hypothetical protein